MMRGYTTLGLSILWGVIQCLVADSIDGVHLLYNRGNYTLCRQQIASILSNAATT